MIASLALVVALGSVPPVAVADARTVERARYLMGTLATAVADAGDAARSSVALDLALDEIARLERVMSSWRVDSELARLNATAGGPFSCSEPLYAVLDSALRFAGETDGAFDPTVEPLNRAWDLRGEGRVPSPSELATALALVGWKGLELEPPRVARLTRPGMGLDLGAIGKGFALDCAADVLRRHGCERALLNLGGELVAISPARAWEVTIAHPARRLEPVIRLAIANGAISTSGQSERGVEVRGKRYGHILDPRRGRPLDTPAAVTVVAASATRADAFSTALLVMGRDRAAELARRHPEIGLLWLEPAGRRVRAWKWNLSSATPEPGAAVVWMN